jgi:hypothetical protein
MVRAVISGAKSLVNLQTDRRLLPTFARCAEKVPSADEQRSHESLNSPTHPKHTGKPGHFDYPAA